MFDFVGKKKIFFTLSILIFVAGIVGFCINGGFNLDIQFQGGSIIEIPMTSADFDMDKAATLAQEVTGKIVTAQSSNPIDSESKEEVNILVLSVSSSAALTDEEHEKIVNTIKENFNVKENAEITTRHVDPSMGKEMASKSALAVFIAAILMLLYVWIRFKSVGGLPAGASAVIALIHDVLVMFSFYAITNLPVNETFIAAVLTIVGYSINDTIIIFDRIRENALITIKGSVADVTNKSIKQTLSRTIITSITTLICVIVVYVVASMNNIDSIKNFMLPLMIGIVSGTYSTIFIASPIWVMFRENKDKKELSSKPAKA